MFPAVRRPGPRVPSSGPSPRTGRLRPRGPSRGSRRRRTERGLSERRPARRRPGPGPAAARMPRRERRAQLLESALEVFVAQGYHAAAMDDIAERAGVSKPVLYQHFPGKLDLYLALLDASCDQIIDNCRVALASTARQQAARGRDHGRLLRVRRRRHRRVPAGLRVRPDQRAGRARAGRARHHRVRRHDRRTSSTTTPACPTRPPGCSRCPWWEWPRSARGSG